jgi:hypothetical protein
MISDRSDEVIDQEAATVYRWVHKRNHHSNSDFDQKFPTANWATPQRLRCAREAAIPRQIELTRPLEF